ncbi:MAG: copper homeostasis protein CutC [Gemmatimonadota bacterium]|nr:copper homeostasis protein CutC [Gemmatimonadota bacterium]MDQ8152619.1 copper homeostasis protein CutC [Gemmatimonadota bacterium]MDQ8169735.1 copper homeostasis protein CutC [Gemmatimonadota bacterium]MDQ8175073.1 copper homeostasis protein CutC [Gemmatimonadota bacterium]
MESLTLVEAYVDQLETACAAERHGAERLELCGPGEGGLTPSPASLHEVLVAVRIPVHAMIRPRTGDFVYTAEEFAAMREGIAMAKAAGAAGVVFGITHADGTLDVARMAELVTLARPLRVGIHRAFDRAPDPEVALDQVIALGIDVVLTSGHAESAEQGIPTLARLVTRAAGRTVILAGGGVRAPNVRRIINETGVHEVHARASDPEVFAAVVRAAHAD